MNIVICSVPVESPGDKLRRLRSEGPHIMTKTAIASLNNWAEKNNFFTKFYDIDMLYPSDEEIENYFTEANADVVGLSAVVSTSYKQVKRLARIIKKINKKALIVCGGYLTAASNTLLRKTEVDVCVVGNGEIAWVGILKLVKKNLDEKKNRISNEELLKVKGIAILENGNLRFSGYGQTLPDCEMVYPSFEYLKSGLLGNEEAVNNYFRKFDSVPGFLGDERSYEKGRKPMITGIFLSKGCVAKCTFCQRGSKGYSVYDLSKLEAHLKNLRDNYNVGFLSIDDENFGSNRKYTYQAVELLNKYNMLWCAFGVRCTNVTKEDLLHYKKNGCCLVRFGIESGSQTILDVMEKKFDVEDIKRAIFSAVDIGLRSPPVGFMLGMPGESVKTARESGKLMGELVAQLKVPVGLIFGNTDICYAIPLVGTPLYEYGKQLGLIGQNVDEEEKYLELTSNVGAYKRYYINFNGASMSEVVFWDMLVFMEATRTYAKLMKNKKVNEKMKKKMIKNLEAEGLNPQIRAKQKNMSIMGAASKIEIPISQYFITNFFKQHVVFNETVAKMPRFLIDPIIKYSMYLEYLIQKYIFKDSHNLHMSVNSKVDRKIRIKEEQLDPLKTRQIERSLRSIVKTKMTHMNMSEKEKVANLLTGGP